VKNRGLRESTIPEVYAPYTISNNRIFAVLLRTIGNPSSFARILNREVLALDSGVRTRYTQTLDDAMELKEYSKPRFALMLFSVFAGVGLILVSIGVYGIVSYTVSQQSRNIGIRMALGATPAKVRAQAMMSGLRFVFVGLGVGLLLAVLLTHLFTSQFWGVSTYDPLTLACVVVVITLVGLAACYVPSLRATRVDPASSLRLE
jgi:putative ABC transport system permease protein